MSTVSDLGERILIVEDEGSLADTVRYILEREGFIVPSHLMDGGPLNGFAPSRRPW